MERTLDAKKIAFITCVNDEDQYRECLFYISRLKVPEGFSVECIAVRGAESMTGGYNYAMMQSDARYKVYMHQDVALVNRTLIEDIVRVFSADEKIGILGVAGSDALPKNGIWAVVREKNTGAVYQLNDGRPWVNTIYGKGSPPGLFRELKLLDGLLLATRYDIPWRADLFTHYHLYDLSQCCEFLRRGYKVVLPRQKNADGQEAPWCLHYSPGDWSGEYGAYRQVFVNEYAEMLVD